jgi:hypothetical protein
LLPPQATPQSANTETKGVVFIVPSPLARRAEARAVPLRVELN